MRSVKSRNWSNKEDEDLAVIVGDRIKNQKKLSWKQIADLLNSKNFDSNKNGKQCRQRQHLPYIFRWLNHINPQVKKLQEWNAKQNEILFSLHQKQGNKWALISNQLPGRTDNCIKNHFYSVMRCGLRKLNSYIRNIKRRHVLVKTFKNQVLNKILTVCEGKNNEKFQLVENAEQIANFAKKFLVQVSLDDHEDDDFNTQIKQKLFQYVSQFTRKCRRKKTKKLKQQSQNEVVSQSNNESIQQEQQKTSKNNGKQNKKQRTKQNDMNQKKIIEKVEQHINYSQTSPRQYKNIQKIVEADKKIQFNTQQVENQPKAKQQELNPVQKIQLIHSGLINSKNLNSFSLGYPQKSNSIFCFGSGTIQSSNQWNKKQMNNFESNRTGFIFSHVPDVTNQAKQFSTENQRGEYNFKNLSTKNTQQIQMLSFEHPIAIGGLQYTFNPLFSSSPFPNEAIPNFTLDSVSLGYSIFNNDINKSGQEHHLRGLKQSQNQQKEKQGQK